MKKPDAWIEKIIAEDSDNLKRLLDDLNSDNYLQALLAQVKIDDEIIAALIADMNRDELENKYVD